MPEPGFDRFRFRIPVSEFSEDLELELSVTPGFFQMYVVNIPFQNTVEVGIYVDSESKYPNESSAYLFIRKALSDYAPKSAGVDIESKRGK